MVAVKMLKEDSSEDVLKDFEREACMLSEFEHPHIVRLLGVCAIGKPMCLLFEFMSRGDLSAYLRACSPNSYLTEKSSIAATTTASSGGGTSCNGGFGGDVKIGHIEQVQIAKQICSGMVYLSDRKFVHRDLASRNCLLDANGSCKIADFGLSQRVYSSHGKLQFLSDMYQQGELTSFAHTFFLYKTFFFNFRWKCILPRRRRRRHSDSVDATGSSSSK